MTNRMITDSDRSEMEMMRLDLEIEMKEENKREANKKKNPRKSIPNEIFFFFYSESGKVLGLWVLLLKREKGLTRRVSVSLSEMKSFSSLLLLLLLLLLNTNSDRKEAY